MQEKASSDQPATNASEAAAPQDPEVIKAMANTFTIPETSITEEQSAELFSKTNKKQKALPERKEVKEATEEELAALLRPAESKPRGPASENSAAAAAAPYKLRIFFQHANGTPVFWDVSTNRVVGGAGFNNPGPEYGIQRFGDFNKDGSADIVFQQNSGMVAVWLLRASSIIGANFLGNPGADFHVVATGDFNGDGKSDHVLQNQNGLPAIWYGNGASPAGGVFLPALDRNWRIAGTGDFNGDGYSDLILQHLSGSVAVLYMKKTAILKFTQLSVGNKGWHLVGTGDLNGDKRTDVIFQNDNGQVGVWLMNGGILQSVALPNPGRDIHVVAVGDANGDGKADIFLQHRNGQLTLWLMRGAQVIYANYMSVNPGQDWRLLGTAQVFGTRTAYPPSPRGLRITSFSSTTLDISWQAANFGATHYVVTVDGRSYVVRGTGFTARNLDPDKYYDVSVASLNDREIASWAISGRGRTDRP